MMTVTDRLSAALADRYRIERRLGEGGMATVYLAKDLKHDRKVALKVLRPELAAVLGADRFVQEIKTTANLQHPHILPLFDSGEADSFLYYVMPFIDGDTLRDKLNRETQLGIEEAVKITAEIADALDYAHGESVIHRDIKPENILLHNGRPLVADFGIALAVSAAAGGRMTETGLSLGTPHYMSPEQATAEKDITHRSDIYSLGSMLYEMLTGEPPHTGGSAQAIIMKIVAEPADPVTKIRKSVPPHVAAATAKSLEKLAADRFETAKAFAEALTNPAFTLTTTQAVANGGAPADWKVKWAVPLAGTAALFALLAIWGWSKALREVPQPVARFSLAFPEEETPQPQFGPGLAWSPDGARFVYSGAQDQLWIQERDQLTATPLAVGNVPVFSPDGQSVAFVAIGGIQTASIQGGQPFTLITTGVEYPTSIDWEKDGYIYFRSALGLARIPGTGGEMELIFRDSAMGPWVDVLPNGGGALMIKGSTADEATVVIAHFDTGDIEPVMPGVYARYAASGHILVAQRDGTVLAAPFDEDALQLMEGAVPLLEGVQVSILNLGASFAISPRGDLLYRSEAPDAVTELVWVTRDGVPVAIEPGWIGDFSFPAISPDGTQLAVVIIENGDEQIWIKELDQGPLPKITFVGTNSRPTWTPDGRSVAYVSDRGNGRELYLRSADGTGGPILLFDAEANGVFEAEFSPDGDWLIYRQGGGFGGLDLYARRMQGIRPQWLCPTRSFAS